jgi:hypothetical protein
MKRPMMAAPVLSCSARRLLRSAALSRRTSLFFVYSGPSSLQKSWESIQIRVGEFLLGVRQQVEATLQVGHPDGMCA